MKSYIRYCILKTYKGILKKKHIGNTHVFFIPVTDQVTYYLILLGKLTTEPDAYICQLVAKLPRKLTIKLVDGEVEYFRGRFLPIEKIECSPANDPEGGFIIKLNKRGKNILSDISLKYSSDYSTERDRIYVLRSKLNLSTEDIDPKTIKMVGTKKSAFIGQSRMSNLLNLFRR